MATLSNGISALQLQRQLAFGSYKTAWLLCAKLRCSMLGRTPARWPASSRLMRSRSPAQQKRSANGRWRSQPLGKGSCRGAVEVVDSGAGPGRIRLSQVPDYSASSLHAFLAANLAPGATAKTDGWSGYPGSPRWCVPDMSYQSIYPRRYNNLCYRIERDKASYRLNLDRHWRELARVGNTSSRLQRGQHLVSWARNSQNYSRCVVIARSPWATKQSRAGSAPRPRLLRFARNDMR